MAHTNFPSQRQFSMHQAPVVLDAIIPIGTTGAVGTITAPGIKAVTRLAAGIYRVQLSDNYPMFLGLQASITPPVTGSSVAAASIVENTIYQIITVGTTTTAQWLAMGVPSGVTPAVGVVFKASATVGSGTGAVKAITVSGITTVEPLGDPDTMLNNQPRTAGNGGYVTLQCLGATNADTTTLIPTDPADGSTIYLRLFLNNASV